MSSTGLTDRLGAPIRRRKAGPAEPAAPKAAPLELAPDACRRRREALGLTSYQLARRAGLQELTVQRFETAAVRPRPTTVVILHNTLRRLEALVPSALRTDA